jgi:hypothetical protein
MGRRNRECRALILVALLATAPSACGGDVVDPSESKSTGGGAGGESPGHAGSSGRGLGGAGRSTNAAAAGAHANGGGQNLVSYPCVGGFVYLEVGGAGPLAGAGGIENIEDVPWTGGLGGESSCVVGQAFCNITSVPTVEIGVPPTGSCHSLAGPLAVCASTPNCACICALAGARGPYGWCAPSCSCTDTDGLATVSCQET